MPLSTPCSPRSRIFLITTSRPSAASRPVRSVATYEQSLSVLQKVKERVPEIYTKSAHARAWRDVDELHEAWRTCGRRAAIC